MVREHYESVCIKVPSACCSYQGLWELREGFWARGFKSGTMVTDTNNWSQIDFINMGCVSQLGTQPESLS